MRRKRRKLKRKAPLVICCLLLLTVLAGCGMLLKDQLMPAQGNLFATDDAPEGFPGRLNVLLLGIDAREGETMARSDTIILASVDQESKQVALLSIPRDTRVSIPGYGMDKINSASVYGGPELALRTVSQLLGTQVKYYVMVNFSGFKDIVDALGGITYEVEQNMYHWDENKELVINLKRGEQRLDGNKALQYVRYRDYPMGDIDRTKYQQKFLMALGKEMLQPSTIPKLPRLVTEINRYVKTNLSVTDMVKFASAAKNLENGNFISQTLPGRPIDNYWGVDPVEARQMLAKLLRGETETNIVLNTPLSGQYAATKPAGQKTGETTTATGQTDQQSGEQAQQNKDGSSDTQKSGQTGQDGKKGGSGGSTTSGSGGKVIITPGGSGTGTTNTGTGNKPGGKTDTKTETDTKPGTNTKPDSSTKSNVSTPGAEQPGATNGTPDEKVVNPSIPGMKVKT